MYVHIDWSIGSPQAYSRFLGGDIWWWSWRGEKPLFSILWKNDTLCVIPPRVKQAVQICTAPRSSFLPTPWRETRPITLSPLRIRNPHYAKAFFAWCEDLPRDINIRKITLTFLCIVDVIGLYCNPLGFGFSNMYTHTHTHTHTHTRLRQWRLILDIYRHSRPPCGYYLVFQLHAHPGCLYPYIHIYFNVQLCLKPSFSQTLGPIPWKHKENPYKCIHS